MEAKTGAISAALIAAAATVTAAVIQVIDTGDDEKGEGTSAPPTGTKVSDLSTPPPDSFKTLLAHLPDTLTGCEPVDTPVMALAKARCRLTPTTTAAGVTLVATLFPDVAHTRADFAYQVPPVVEATERVCPDGPDRSDYQTRDDSQAGLLACWVAVDNRPYVVWTRDAAKILVIAQGEAGGTIEDLWPAWKNVPIRPAPASATASATT